jgi:hypothetical protein
MSSPIKNIVRYFFFKCANCQSWMPRSLPKCDNCGENSEDAQ